MWPRLHIREICTVLPIDSPETVRYFFKAVAKNLNGDIIPLPSYSPIGNGQAIGTMSNPAEIPLPGTVDLLAKIGATSANTHIEKDAMIIGWEGVDPEGNDVSDADDNIPILYTLDADGKMELHINVNPKGDYQLLDVVTGFMDYEHGVFSVSSSRQAETNGKVTKIKLKANATTAEHNISPKISFDSKQVKFQVKDVQLSAEWTQQYVTDMNKRTGMDVLSELVVIMGNQTQLTINRMILDDIIMHVGRHGDNIRKFIAEPSKARNSFAYTKKQWADELLYHIEKCSARIYTATNNMGATHIVANPEDLVWLEMLDSFSFHGDFIKGGQHGHSNVGTISNGKAVISTPLMPQGYMLLASKPTDLTLANYIFSPYVPLSVSPYPLGQIPAMSFTSRFANEMIRPEGFGIVKIY